MESGTPEILNTAVGSGAAGTPVACRWNPTKEQINMLESLYGQGLRTPTAEQIQEITAKLQAYGHIEGKNVFYWFQNHKARQRQKEKQDRLSLFRQFNHHHRHPHPPFIHLPPPPHVVFDPCCYMPQNNLRFYDQQHSQVVSPTTSNRTIQRRSPRATKPKSADAVMHRPENAAAVAGGNKKTEQDGIVYGQKYNHQETLDLFPLHPTGILQERVDSKSINSSCLPAAACTSSSSGGAVDRLYFDFFC